MKNRPLAVILIFLAAFIFNDANAGTLFNTTPASTYGNLFQFPTSNIGLSTTLVQGQDGKGNGTPFYLSTTGAEFTAKVIFNLNSSPLPASVSGSVIQEGNANATITRHELDSFAVPSHFSTIRFDGTASSPSALQSGDEIGGFNSWGYNGSAVVGPSVSFKTFAAENWSSGHQGTYADVATTAVGSTTLTSALRFNSDGGILIPATVTGGSQGAGTLNASGLFINGTSVNSASILTSGNISSSRLPAFTGDVSTSAGSSTTTLATVNSNTGNYQGLTINGKGLITAASMISSRLFARVATTANLTATYSNGTSGVGATLTNSSTQAALVIDSVTLNTGDRVLVKNQSTSYQNGIYTVTNTGSGSTNWVLTRANDFDGSTTGNVAEGVNIGISEGSANDATIWMETAQGPFTLGTTTITWSQASGTSGGGSGTVTSVALTGDGTIFNSSVSGSPIITNGTLAPSLMTQTANTILSGPASGSVSAPTFRTLVGADLPNPTTSVLGGVKAYVAVSHQWINAISIGGLPASTQPAFTDISGNINISQMNSGTSASSSTFWRGDGTWAAPSGGGAVSSVSNSDSSLTITPTTGAVVASLNVGNANTWTGAQTFNAIVTTGSGRVLKARVVTASGSISVTSADDVVIVNKTTGAATTVNLPSSPATGLRIIVKDGKGDSGTNNITITPASGTIDGQSTLIINTAYGSFTLIYNGTQWNII